MAGVIYLVQTSRSERFFLSIMGGKGHEKIKFISLLKCLVIEKSRMELTPQIKPLTGLKLTVG